MTDNRGQLRSGVLPAAALLLAACGCTLEMYDQPRGEPLEAVAALDGRLSAGGRPAGTVARGERRLGDAFFTGKNVAGRSAGSLPEDPRSGRPQRLTRGFLQRGRERFDAFCSHCHGRTGAGDGMVVRRGFRRPPSLHDPRLRNETSNGQLFDVITHGLRTMPAQASRIPPGDRWAIVAYVRVLQRSQHLPLDEAPDDVRRRFSTGLEGAGQGEGESRHGDSSRDGTDQP